MELASESPAEIVSARPQGPRTGRRAANNLIPAASGIEDVSVDNNPVVPAGPRPQVPRRRGGWGDASSDGANLPIPPVSIHTSTEAAAASEANMQLGGMSRRKAAQTIAKETREPEPTVESTQIEDADTFMDIPDLDAEEDLSRKIAEAPAVRSVSVLDIAELESEDLFRLSVAAKDHEIDLSLLTACLCPADEVAEELVTWDHEFLLTEIASALNAERNDMYSSSAMPGQQVAV